MNDTKEETPGLCRCGKNEATDPHTCPYKSEINDDDETLCTCCADCTTECAYEI